MVLHIAYPLYFFVLETAGTEETSGERERDKKQACLSCSCITAATVAAEAAKRDKTQLDLSPVGMHTSL